MPALTSFRDLIEALKRGGVLRSVSRAVDPRYELIAVMRAVQKAGNEPLLFTNVAGSPAPVATNILGRRDVLAMALGLEPRTLLPSLVAQEAAQLDPVIVTDAPVHEVVQTGGFDIARDIPQVVHSERDAGAYITAGICIARHPATGVYNASWNRIQLAGGDHTRVRMMPPQHLGQYQQAAEQDGAPLPVAVAIGAPPALMLSAASKIPFDADEYRTAGGWQGTPLRLARAKTVPLDVPADAEFVIEGHVLPHVREAEGPFGEFTDGYVEVGQNHVLKVSAITRRRDAIYHVILAGGTEDSVLLGVPLMTEVWKKVAPLANVRDIGFPGHIFGCVISLDKADDAQPRAVLRGGARRAFLDEDRRRGRCRRRSARPAGGAVGDSHPAPARHRHRAGRERRGLSARRRSRGASRQDRPRCDRAARYEGYVPAPPVPRHRNDQSDRLFRSGVRLACWK